MFSARALSTVLAGTLLSGAAMAQSKEDKRRYVAIVVGLSSYANLPDEVALNFGRSDAATVASSLQELGRFDYVFLMTDREATRENIRETLRVKAAQFTGRDDLLLIYFVGHGLGADSNLPILMAYDSTLEAGHEDGLEVSAFAQDIATWTASGSTVFVTDAIHKNKLEGTNFFGPSAEQWPQKLPNTMYISATGTSTPGEDGLFGVIFADAVAGAADADADRQITASELRSYIDTRLTGSGQEAAYGGVYEEDMVIASGVTPGATATGGGGLNEGTVYGDHEVYSAKFVFRDGASPTVECREAPKKACDPICYVRRFKAGPCTITAISDGGEVRGVTLALVPGRYSCGLRSDGSLSCIPPQLPSAPPSTREE
jgi:hypothetical protein